jgi:4-hydroxy-3-methylbut-2-enyl diphosphate reductase
VPKSVPAAARERRMMYLDATCPLVSKVHREAERHHATGAHILLIGHGGHPEVVGTMGHCRRARHARRGRGGRADRRAAARPARLHDADDALGGRHGGDHRRAAVPLPEIGAPVKEDICYATTNRQAAVKAIAGGRS